MFFSISDSAIEVGFEEKTQLTNIWSTKENTEQNMKISNNQVWKQKESILS